MCIRDRAIGDPDTTVGVAGSAKQKDARATGRMLAKEAMEKAGQTAAPAYFYMVASPAEEEDYLKGIEDVIGRVPFFGGSAADNTVSGEWSIYTNDKVFSDGCAVAFFYTDKPMANVYTCLLYTSWAINLAIPIIICVANVTIFILTLVSVHRYLKYAVYQLIIFVLSMIPLIIFFAFPGVITTPIFMIISSSIALFTFVCSLILCGRSIMEELDRRLHM